MSNDHTPTFYVVVGNIGKVYEGPDHEAAKRDFDEYVQLSKDNYGRVGGEDVILFEDCDIIEEFTGSLNDCLSQMGFTDDDILNQK
jgi:hypothetical protein